MEQHTQHPLVAVLPAPEIPPSTYELEGQAMLAAACELRARALTLPEPSGVRDRMLASADHWSTAARLHGVTQPRLQSA